MSDREFSIDWPHGHMIRGVALKAEIVRTNLVRQDRRTILAIATEKSGFQNVYTFYENGRFYKDETNSMDLINAPAPKVRHELWVQLYWHPAAGLYLFQYSTLEEARNAPKRDAIGEPQCVFAEVDAK